MTDEAKPDASVINPPANTPDAIAARVEETQSAIANATVAPVLMPGTEEAPATPLDAQRLVMKAEHRFTPPDYLPVVITKNSLRPFRFTEPFRYQIIVGGQTILDIEITKGFECDLGSFPWWSRWLPGLTQAGPHFRALAIHDWLYRTQIVDKVTADFIVREIMLIDGVPTLMRVMIIAAVLVGGEGAWNENTRLLEDAAK